MNPRFNLSRVAAATATITLVDLRGRPTSPGPRRRAAA